MTVSAIAYATLAQARDEIKEVGGNVDDDPYMLAALRFATERIDAEVREAYRPFAPEIKTRYLTARSESSGGHLSGLDLVLPYPLLATTTVTNGDGAVIASPNYSLLPKSDTPYRRLHLLGAGTMQWLPTSDGETEDAIAVAGTWGYRRDYANAWLNSGDKLTTALTDTTTTAVTFQNAGGLDAFGRANRLSPGQLWQVDSEWMECINVASATAGTVRRGARGSTPTTHLINTPIFVFEPEPNIQRATLRWASYLYKRRAVFEDSQYDGVVAVRFPKDMPEEVANILKPYRQQTRILEV
jgi:hypothetical protein